MAELQKSLMKTLDQMAAIMKSHPLYGALGYDPMGNHALWPSLLITVNQLNLVRY